VARKGETRIRGKADLPGKIVGVQMGSGSEQLVDKMLADGVAFAEVKRYNYNPEAFLDLKAKRIDALVVGYAYAVNQIKKDPSYAVVGDPLAEAEIVMVMPKGADELAGALNTALAAIRADGTYATIHDRWLKVD
jgi:polar amino acid transport system substrate-binding protein